MSSSTDASSCASSELAGYLSVALELAHAAGVHMLKTWQVPPARRSHATKSGSADCVTATDKECERLIIDGITSRFPTHKIIAEESHAVDGVYNYDDTPTWIVDPVDGTNNFVHALPHVCVSIGLMIRQSIVVGVVHAPVFGTTYYATAGGGAWIISGGGGGGASQQAQSDAQRLHASNIGELQHAAVATEMGYDRSDEGVALLLLKLKKLLERKVQSVRMYGSCCLNMCQVAQGNMEAYYEGTSNIRGPKPWDVAAASLIVTESGGVISDLDGAPFSLWCGRVLVAGNNNVAKQLHNIMNEANTEIQQQKKSNGNKQANL